MREEGITRAQLIEAAEVAFLYNREATVEWVRGVLEWKRQRGWNVDTIRGLGLIKRFLTRGKWATGDQVDGIIDNVPRAMTDTLIRRMHSLPHGRKDVSFCAFVINRLGR